MPPKNKKQLEEQAKKLQQQQKRRQQQERRLQEQRKKYAAQKLNTGLILPVSNQLIIDFSTQQSSFIIQKLNEVFGKQYDSLKDQRVIKQISKQMLYHIKNAKKLFQLTEKSKLEQNKQKFIKVRAICGIFLALFLNNHHSILDSNVKSKQQDQNLLKRVLLNLSQSKTQTQHKIFNKNEVIAVLNYFKESYFSHFLILHKSKNFPKREDQKTFTIHIASPYAQFNTVHTTFIDLSSNKNEAHHSENQDKKSDE